MNFNTGIAHGYSEAIPARPIVSGSTRGYKIWQNSLRGIAALALAGMLPVFATIWLVNKFTSKGPLLFKQERPGLNGKTFEIYKIRTMHLGSEKKTALGTTNDNPCITPLGRILRKLKIDEAPQLLNIVRGDMTVVGPRPIPITLDQELRKFIPYFEKRYTVTPGLTSIGQICINDNEVDEKLIEDWSLRFEGELHYIRSQSVGYDLMMIGMTTLYVFRKTLNR